MNTIRRIAKNTIVMLAGDIAGKVLTFIFVILSARYLQAEGFGVLSFALAFTGMFGIFSDIGFYELIVREVARNKGIVNKYVENITSLKFITLAVVYGLMCITINTMKYPIQTIMVVYLIGLSVVVDAFTLVFNATFQAFEKMEYISFGKILKNSILLIGALLIIALKMELISFAWVYLIASSSLLAYSFVIATKISVKPRLRIEVKFSKWLIKEGVTFWSAAVFATLLNNIDKVMLSLMVGDVAVGIYSAAFRLVSTLNFLPIAFMGSIYPVSSRLAISTKESLRFVFEKSVKYLLIIGILIGLPVTFLSDKLILLIYGLEYAHSADVLRILIWSQVLLFGSMAFENLFKSIGRQIIITYAMVIAVGLNVGMNWILIPKYSFIGASLSAFMARFITFLVFFIVVIKSEYKMSYKSLMNFLKLLLSILIVGGLTWIIRNFNDNALILTSLSLLVYVFAIVTLRIIDSSDIQIIKGLIGKLSRIATKNK